MIREYCRAVVLAIALHLLFGVMLVCLYLALDGLVGTVWLVASIFFDITSDPLPPDIAGLARLTNGLETAVVGAAFGVVGLCLGWLALRVFWRLASTLEHMGMRAAP